MPPDAFTFDTSGQLVMQTAIGGAGTLFGPLVGAAIWLYLSDFFQNTLHLGSHLEAGARHRVRAARDVSCATASSAAIADLFALASGAGASRTRRRSPTPTAAMQAAMPGAAPSTLARPRPARRMATSCCKPTASPSRYGGLHRQSATSTSPSAGRIARRHRPQRRRQEHVLQDADLRSEADFRPDHVQRPRHHRLGRHRSLPARPDQELSGQPAVHTPDGARERRDRGARPEARAVPARTCCATPCACRACKTRSRRRSRSCG